MARKTKVVIVCDRHRGEVEATATAELAIDGTRTKLDLCAEHAAELRRLLRPWMRAGTSTTTRAPAKKAAGTTRARKAGGARRSTDGPAIRAWAREQGLDIPDRGRIPAAVREAYYAAH